MSSHYNNDQTDYSYTTDGPNTALVGGGAASGEDNAATASWMRYFGFLVFPVAGLILLTEWLKHSFLDNNGFGRTTYPAVMVSMQPYWSVWGWHPFLMMLGFGVLMPAAAMAFKSLPLERTQRKTIHGVLMTLAWISTTIALAVVVHFKNVTGNWHVYTSHGIFGIVTYGAFTAQYIGGVVSYALKLPTENMRKSFLPLHVFIGLSTFLAGGTAIATGIFDRQRISNQGPNSSLFRVGGWLVCVHFIGVLGVVWVLGRFSHAEKAGTGKGHPSYTMTQQ